MDRPRPRATRCFLVRLKVPKREFSSRFRVSDYACVFTFQFEGNRLRVLRNDTGITIGPLDERNAVAENVIVESEPANSLAIFDPVKIEMINGQAVIGVFDHEHE